MTKQERMDIYRQLIQDTVINAADDVKTYGEFSAATFNTLRLLVSNYNDSDPIYGYTPLFREEDTTNG